MTVCRYYLQGRCRYGNRCWNEHSVPSPVRQGGDQYNWVSPSVGSGDYSQAQFPRTNFSSNYREPTSRYIYNSDYDPRSNFSSSYRQPTPKYDYSSGYDLRSNFSSKYREPVSRYNYEYDSRSSSPSMYREPISRYNYEYDSRSSSPTKNQYPDRYGTGNATSRNYDQYNRGSYQRSSAPKKNTSFQLKPSNRFVVLDEVNDAEKAEKDNSLISVIKSEIVNWENTHIWPFSCCSHFRDFGTCLRGFVDISPEELRYRAYEAETVGAFTLYISTVTDALNEIKKKWAVLKNPTPVILQSIEKGYFGTPDFCEENLKKLLPESTAGSFGSEQQVSSGISSQEPSKATAFSFKTAHLNSSESVGSSTSAFRTVLPANNTVGSSFAFSSSPSVPSSASSGFGSTNARTAALSEVKSCAYTELKNITDDEKAQFLSQTFTLGKIPSRPPPVELCF